MTLQPVAIVYPDVELLLTTYLRQALSYEDEVYVSNAVPAPRRSRMVIARRDGGTSDGIRDRARVSFRVWGTSEQNTTDLASLVVAYLSAAPDGNPILSVRHLSGPSPVADESNQPLRYLLAEVSTRGQLLGA